MICEFQGFSKSLFSFYQRYLGVLDIPDFYPKPLPNIFLFLVSFG